MSSTEHDVPRAATEKDAERHRTTLAELQSRFGDVLTEMQSDNPPDPVHLLREKIENVSAPSSRSSRLGGSESTQRLRRNEVDAKYPKSLATRPLTVVVFGASGDLAQKKTFAGLFHLFRNGYLPPCTSVVGYARSDKSVDDIREGSMARVPDVAKPDVDDFFHHVAYVRGEYDSKADFDHLASKLKEVEQKAMSSVDNRASAEEASANRIFYLVVPPDIFLTVAENVKRALIPDAHDGFTRVIVEKPFGSDAASAQELTDKLLNLFREDQICRVDHYLGKEVLRGIFTTRFANRVWSSVWSREHIDNVQICFKETEGINGRGEYYDKYGVVRDVMQNHMMQILALVAMDKPASMSADDVRNARTEILRAVRPINPDDCVIGQYTAPSDGSEPGYLDEDGVDKDSNTPTYATLVAFIDNDRWRGVPFVIQSGKALDEKTALVRIQFKDEPFFGSEAVCRNELVFRLQPDEAAYLTLAAKRPGMAWDGVTTTDLDLSLKERFLGRRIPEAYEPLLFESIVGDMTHCVRADELQAAWDIFTPLLQAVDKGTLRCKAYPMGSGGPEEADALAKRFGFKRNEPVEERKHADRPNEGGEAEERSKKADGSGAPAGTGPREKVRG